MANYEYGGSTGEKLEEIAVPENKHSIKLTKSSRGYGWAIKVYSDDAKSMVETIEEINKDMVKKFPNEVDLK